MNNNYEPCIWNPASGLHGIGRKSQTMTSWFVKIASSSILFDVIVFFFLSLESGLSFMTLSVLVLEL